MKQVIIDRTNLYDGCTIMGNTNEEIMQFTQPIKSDFHLVKVLDSKYADSYLNGILKFGTLASYRNLNITNNRNDVKKTDDAYGRFDLYEGVFRISDRNTDPFWNACNEDFKQNASSLWYVSREIDTSYAHCMFALDDISIKYRHCPSSHFASFGDTAIFVLNKNEFINRIVRALKRLSKADNCQYILGIGPVIYTRCLPNCINLTPFVKYGWYSWQQEFRFLIMKLDGNGQPAVMDSFLLDIGDIRDIAVNMPVVEFINLRIIPALQADFPLSEANKALIPHDFKEFYSLNQVTIDLYTLIGDAQRNCILKSDGMFFSYDLFKHELRACYDNGSDEIVPSTNNPFL